MLDTVRSRRGVFITKRTTDVMQRFLETVEREGGSTISYGVARLADGTISVSLGGDYGAPSNAISDEVDGITFYWYADPPEFAALESYIVDTPGDGPTRLIEIDEDNG